MLSNNSPREIAYNKKAIINDILEMESTGETNLEVIIEAARELRLNVLLDCIWNGAF